ncbi:MAG: bifunctional DNA primase/helicase, partial [Verrucomicrobiaceae bacterium]
MSGLPSAEISRRLAEQAERVCQRLLPGGRIVKDDWVCGDLSSGEGKSLKVHLTGTYAGHWKDWATDERGDLLDLWRLALNLSPGETYRQAKAWLGITDPIHREPRSFNPAPVKKDPPPEPEGRVFAWLTGARKLKPETLALFRVAADPKTRHLIFPCFAPGGELQNRGYRSFPVPGEKKRVWQDTGCAPCLFGWHALPESAYRSRTVLIAEGQIDAMTWRQWGIAALSIPGGSSGTWIDWEWDNLAFFDKILLSFDADGAGQENLRKTVARLGIHRCLVVRLPGKDANECLQAGHTAADAARWIAEASPPPLKGLVRAAD